MGDRQAAISFYNQAVTALQDAANPQRKEHAFKLFTSACVADPTYGEAYYQNGCNLWDYKLTDASIASFRRALTCDMPLSVRAKAFCNLGWQLHTAGQEEEALSATEQALTLDDSLTIAWVNKAMILGTLGHPQEGLVAAKHAYELDCSQWDQHPADPTVEMCLAFSYLFTGNFVEGFKHFESRFPYKLRNYLSFPYAKWRGEEGKTIFVVADQGLGDTVSFARFIEHASKRAKYLHILIQPACIRLFQHAFMHLNNINLLPDPSPFPPADYWTTFVSLPFALGLSNDEIRSAPEIDYPVYQLPNSWKNANAKFHIGIAWAGSPLNLIDPHRNIPILRFLDLVEVPGVQLYSLQVSDRKTELHSSGCGALIRDLSAYVNDVVDTLSLLQELDLVITCESALGHIAAMADKETWIPYSFLGRDYRLSLDGSDRLWRPRTRTFNQGSNMSWVGPFREMERELRRKVERHVKANAQAGQPGQRVKPAHHAKHSR